MSIEVFVGPTIDKTEVTEILGTNVTCHPPAKQGDILLATERNPRVIAIVDGFFASVPSVWHKEILWAMQQGIHVYGAASMGALRAAELYDFGMIGVGKIFQDYYAGVLEDDDEVALVHAPQELNYQALSEPMVDIRATLKEALSHNIISPKSHDTCIAIGKKIFYAERTYPRLISLAQEVIPSSELQALGEFIKVHKKNQKKEDAQLMLKQIKTQYFNGLTPKKVTYFFSYTDSWNEMKQTTLSRQRGGFEDANEEQAFLDELKIQGDFSKLHKKALLRRLALELAQMHQVSINQQNLKQTIEEFCIKHNFLTGSEISIDKVLHWCKTQQINIKEFDDLMKTEARLDWVSKAYGSNLISEITDILRLEGNYGFFKEKVIAKKNNQVLTNTPLPVDSQKAIDWYFDEKLNRDKPESLSIYLKQEGFRNLEEFEHKIKEAYLSENFL